MSTQRIDFENNLPKLEFEPEREFINADKFLAGKTKSLQGTKLDAGDYSDTTQEKVSLITAVQDPDLEIVTPEYIKQISSIKLSSGVAQACADLMNEATHSMDTGLARHYRDSCIDLIEVFTSGTKAGFRDYLNAVKFVFFTNSGDSQVKAYAKTFPKRVLRMEQEQLPANYLQAYAHAYAKSKLVIEVKAKSLVPTHIMYQDYFHMAVKTQVELMTDTTVSPKVRTDAANSLMTHLKTPEIKQAELKVKVQESDAISQLRDVMSNLANAQRSMIDLGQADIIDIASTDIYREG